MLLRGIWAHRGQAAAMVAVVVLVTGGCFVVSAFGSRYGLSMGPAAGLLLVGVTALGRQAALSVRHRRHEIALAAMRGRHGLRLLAYAVAEPSLLVAVGVAVGVVLGWLASRWLAVHWAGGGSTSGVTWQEWGTVGAVAVVALATIVAMSWRTVNDQLVRQLDRHDRTRPATVGGLFLQVLVLIGAVVTVYQARQARSSGGDLVSLLSPAVVGLAVGEVVAWILAGWAAWSSRRRRHRGRRSIGAFLTARRFARRAGTVSPAVPVVAAGVLVAVAASAWAAGAEWRSGVAKIELGGARVFSFHGVQDAVHATHSVDPSGRWLMAAVAFPERGGGGYRRVFVDMSRWARVEGGFFAGTPAGQVTAFAGRFATPPAIQTRPRFTLVTERTNLGWVSPDEGLLLDVSYDNGSGIPDQAVIRIGRHYTVLPDGRRRYSVVATGCEHGCYPVSISVSGPTRRTAPPGSPASRLVRQAPLRITKMTFGSQNLLAARFQNATFPGLSVPAVKVRRVGGALEIVSYDESYAPIGRLPPRRHVFFRPSALLAPHTSLDLTGGTAGTFGLTGNPVAVQRLGTVGSVPFLGGRGALLDLRAVLPAGGPVIPAARAYVVARADTPPGVLARLRASPGAGNERTYADELAALQQKPGALSSRVYLLIALVAALVALVALVAGITEQSRERRSEAASLRVVGVAPRLIGRGYRREALLLALAAGLGSAAGAVISSYAVLDVLPIVPGGALLPPLDAAPRPLWIAVGAVGALVMVAVVVDALLRRVGATSPPRLLRETQS